MLQHYLQDHAAERTVLLAPIPPTGARRITMQIARHHPLTFAKINAGMTLAPVMETEGLAREMLFAPQAPDSCVDECRQRLQNESYRAFLDMLVLDLVKTKRVTPGAMLILGAEHDAMVLPHEIQRTATVYGAEAEIFGELGHEMMLEPGWRQVAERIDGWLVRNGC